MLLALFASFIAFRQDEYDPARAAPLYERYEMLVYPFQVFFIDRESFGNIDYVRCTRLFAKDVAGSHKRVS